MQPDPDFDADAVAGISPQAQALLDAVIAISSDLDLHTILERIVASAVALTGAQYAVLGVNGPNGDLVDFATTGSEPPTLALGAHPPIGRDILELLIDEPETFRLDQAAPDPESSGSAPNDPPQPTFLRVPVQIRGTVLGSLHLTEKANGLTFTLEDERFVRGLAIAVGFVIANTRAFALSERRRQWLEESIALDEALQPPIEAGEALQRIARSARIVSRANATGVVQATEETGARLTAHDGPDALRSALLEGAGIADVATAGGFTEVLLNGRIVLALPLRAHLWAPARLVVLFEQGRDFDSFEETELLVSFAEYAALALDRAQAVEDRAKLAVVSDRERIARDLHDVVIQKLFGTGMQLRALHSADVTPEINKRLDLAVDELDLIIREIRSTIFALQIRS